MDDTSASKHVNHCKRYWVHPAQLLKNIFVENHGHHIECEPLDRSNDKTSKFFQRIKTNKRTKNIFSQVKRLQNYFLKSRNKTDLREKLMGNKHTTARYKTQL
jgi:hypothetical protein